MSQLKINQREKNFFQFRPPIFDFEFRREGSEILLAFSAKADVTRDLRVRLYETESSPTRAERRKLIETEQQSRLLQDGLLKSGCFVKADGKLSVAELAATRGFEGDELVLAHFANRLLKDLRGGSPEDGDMVFIPQLRRLGAIPLGPVLSVEDVDESVADGGHRHQARFDIEQQQYDPLDPTHWVPDSLLTLSPATRVTTTVFDEASRRLWLPQFAVLTATGEFLEASPAPPEVVEETGYTLSGDDPHAFAVLAGKGSRLLSAESGSVAFQTKERPLGAYGAVVVTEEA
jgi:hypothetical protein